MITSPTNPKIKYIRRLQNDSRFRQREGMFVVEGSRWLFDLLQQGVTPSLIVCTPEWQQREQGVSLPVAPWLVDAAVMAEVSDVATPPGVVVVTPIRPRPWPARPTWLLILDQLRNPGNLGTVLRAAAAAGVDGVILGPGSVDAYNPKVLRGSMGAHLRLPICTLDWPGIAGQVNGLQVWVATADGETVYTDVNWTRPSALIIGNEATGCGPEAAALATGRVAIPMAAATESINAALAAGILLFEAARQKRRRA